jgi:hypothetical protein
MYLFKKIIQQEKDWESHYLLKLANSSVETKGIGGDPSDSIRWIFEMPKRS